MVTVENICSFFLKNKTKIFLVFRITTTVFHLAPFVYVCAGANVFVGLCV